MGEMIEIEGADGFGFGAYHALPPGACKGGVIVVQEIFGLDEHVRRDVDRWASMGFEALAPSMFDRGEKGFTAAHDPAGMAAGVKLARSTPIEQALADVAACRDYLSPRGKVFIVGYCYGGSIAWLAAARVPGLAAAASYYGGMVKDNAALKPACPTIVHLGGQDTMIDAAEVAALIGAANPDVPVHIYDDAGHGFNNDDPARHESRSADLARERTVALFARDG